MNTSNRLPVLADEIRAALAEVNTFARRALESAIEAGTRLLEAKELCGHGEWLPWLAECTEAEIATITGHSLRDVRSILDAHYLHRDPALAESAIRKLETNPLNAGER
jgi:hypothetical protein